MSDVIEGQVVEETTAIVPAPAAPPATLFRTDDPQVALERAKRTADALASVIKGTSMVVNVKGKDYLTVEAWQTLGSQVGVTPVIVSTKKLSEPAGWEARCEARTFDGRVLGAADSMCLSTEPDWGGDSDKRDRQDFELRSMAQTRAMSRALSSVLRFIPTLAGMGGTPAEEMGRVQRSGGGGPRKPSQKQLDFLDRLIGDNYDGNQANVVRGHVSTLDGAMVSKAISGLKEGDASVRDALLQAAESRAAESELPADTTGLESPADEGFDDLPFSTDEPGAA